MNLACKVALAIVLLALAVLVAAKEAIDPWNSHGFGPGWECDRTSGGATTCARDIPPALQRKPNSN